VQDEPQPGEQSPIAWPSGRVPLLPIPLWLLAWRRPWQRVERRCGEKSDASLSDVLA